MRNLTEDETRQVTGGVGIAGAVIGGISAGLASAYQGGTPRAIATSAALGALGGFSGGMMSIAGSFLMRTTWGVRAIGFGTVASLVPNELGPAPANSAN